MIQSGVVRLVSERTWSRESKEANKPKLASKEVKSVSWERSSRPARRN
jgi:hypothetical protein